MLYNVDIAYCLYCIMTYIHNQTKHIYLRYRCVGCMQINTPMLERYPQNSQEYSHDHSTSTCPCTNI